MDYTYALEAVAEHTGWHTEDVIMIAEYSDGYGFLDRSGAEWLAFQRYGEFVVLPCE